MVATETLASQETHTESGFESLPEPFTSYPRMWHDPGTDDALSGHPASEPPASRCERVPWRSGQFGPLPGRRDAESLFHRLSVQDFSIAEEP